MMTLRTRSLALLLLSLLGWPLLGGAPAEKQASEDSRHEIRKEASAEEIPAEPQAVKGRVAVWVFLVWVWGTAIVSILFLRLKIKECDRLHRMAFYQESGRPPRDEKPSA